MFLCIYSVGIWKQCMWLYKYSVVFYFELTFTGSNWLWRAERPCWPKETFSFVDILSLRGGQREQEPITRDFCSVNMWTAPEKLVFSATAQDSQRGSLVLFPSVNFTKAHFPINQLYLFMRTPLMDSSHMDSCIEEVKTNGYALSQLSLTRCQNRQYYTLCLLADGICRLFFFHCFVGKICRIDWAERPILLLGAEAITLLMIAELSRKSCVSRLYVCLL